ncbi:MAG: hypothetical protein AAFX09_07610 [Pseudomonadota bacterium]
MQAARFPDAMASKDRKPADSRDREDRLAEALRANLKRRKAAKKAKPADKAP